MLSHLLALRKYKRAGKLRKTFINAKFKLQGNKNIAKLLEAQKIVDTECRKCPGCRIFIYVSYYGIFSMFAVRLKAQQLQRLVAKPLLKDYIPWYEAK